MESMINNTVEKLVSNYTLAIDNAYKSIYNTDTK